MKPLIPILSIIFAGCLAFPAPAATYATKDYVDRMDATNRAEIVSSTNSLYQSIAISNYYTKAETDDAIDTLAAYYITSNANGDAFPTLSALTNASAYYSGGAVRVPTRNDYAVVLADESHGGSEWRYIYTIAEGATTGQWDAQYPIETNDYEGLGNKPQINGHTLTGNMTAEDLGLARLIDLPPLTNGLPTMADIPSTNGFVTAAVTNNCLQNTGGEVVGSSEDSLIYSAHDILIYGGLDQTPMVRVEDYSGSVSEFKAGAINLNNGASSAITMYATENNVNVALENTDGNASISISGTSATLTVGGTNVMSYIAQTGADAKSSVSAAASDGTNYTDTAIATADTTYKSFALTAPTNINQSVQYINVTADTPITLDVLLPEGNGTKDWLIYVQSVTNVSISLPAATWWMADVAYTNDIAPATPTALYFSQIDTGLYLFSRQELAPVTISAP